MSEAIASGGGALVRLIERGVEAATVALSQFSSGTALQQGPAQESALADLETFAVHDMAQAGLGVEIPFTSRPSSTFVMVFDDVSARSFVRRMLGAMAPTPALTDSVLLEAGNITACAFGDALARHTRVPWVPTVPNLRRGVVADVVRASAPADAALVLTAQFIAAELDLQGRFVWLADLKTVRTLASRLSP
jgi:chemotaxis protein CheY-P-specific phosphatase CheC